MRRRQLLRAAAGAFAALIVATGPGVTLLGVGDSNKRRIEVFRDGVWTRVRLLKLRIGDRFRMFEPTGESVRGNNGSDVWKALDAPYMHDHGEGSVATIQAVDVA